MKRLLTRLRPHLASAAAGVTNLLYPPRCLSCAADLVEPPIGAVLCSTCRTQLAPAPPTPRCSRCAGRSARPDDASDGCFLCHSAGLEFDAALALGNYRTLLRTLVLRMKHKDSEALTLSLAELVWHELGESLRAAKADVVLPVPMHWWRRVQRGTNSADLLAGRLASRLKLLCLDNVLSRHRNTHPQGSLPAGERFRNMRGAFRLRWRTDLRGARILLVDDILTTGATCSEIARVLKQAGAAHITVAVVARAPGQN